MTYALESTQIIASAQKHSAERICFKTDGEFTIVPLDLPAVKQALVNNYEGRVKYQKRIDGRWQDCSTYSRVLDVKRIFDDLATDAFRGKLRCGAAELQAAASLNTRRFHTTLRTVLRHVHNSVHRSFDIGLIKRMRSAFDGIELKDEFYKYFLSTLHCLHLLFEQDLKTVLEEPEKQRVHTLLQEIEAVRDGSSVGHILAFSNIKAKLLSLVDRDAAAKEFSRVIEADAEGIIEFFYIDMGAFTYLSDADLHPEADNLAKDVIESISPEDTSEPVSPTAVVISADPHFFRLYGPMMMFYAQQLPELDFIFVIVGDQNTVSEVIREGQNYANTLSTFNSAGDVKNTRFFRCPIPDFVIEEKTFFATCRFFAGSKFIDEYDGVYMMDIDLRFDEDPTKYLEWLHNRPFACSVSGGLPTLSPWRRYMAGNVFMRYDISTRFVEALQRYIITGLHRANSWMMDQNAMTYAIEHSYIGENFAISSFGRRPTSQAAFRATWEANYNRNQTVESLQQ